jgi:acyl transferase domain-containing protein
MVVLPGSFYVEMALCLEREAFKRETNLVRKVTFENPIILSAEDTVIKVEANEGEDGWVNYAFYEAGVDGGSDDPTARKCAARLAIDRNGPASSRLRSDAFSIEAFQTKSDSVIDAKEFYGTLRENGNQYGPRFRNVSSIWRMGDQSLGRLSATHEHERNEPHVLHPCLLDAVTQLLAPFVAGKGKTFILRAIEKVEIADLNLPDTLWGHATLQPAGDGDKRNLVRQRLSSIKGRI